MKQFIDKFCNTYRIKPEHFEELISEMDFRVFKKGEYIVNQDHYNENLYIIKTGIVRAFRNYEGEEISLWFSTDATMIFQI